MAQIGKFSQPDASPKYFIEFLEFLDKREDTKLAREFRNLIHPGCAQRLGQKCDRGTALFSIAALDHVVRDLSK
jgi:hypothetical protein